MDSNWSQESNDYTKKKTIYYGYEDSGTRIFKAECTKNGNKCVIKQISLSKPQNWVSLKNELQFIKTNMTLHANVIQYYAIFKINDKQAWIVMEDMRGSIDNILELKSYPMSDHKETVCIILREILKGITHLHRYNILHRDIKPQNALWSFDGAIKICDFGTLGIVGKDPRKTFCGTYYYMAPEMVRRTTEGQTQEKQTEAVDIWSFGVLCCHVASGTIKPHTDEKYTAQYPPTDLLRDIGYNNLKPIIPKEFGREFVDLVENCLQSKPEDRPSALTLLGHDYFKAMVMIDGREYLKNEFKKMGLSDD